MKKHMRILILTAVAGLFATGIGLTHRAEAQIVPTDVARICLEDPEGQRLDLRVYSASGEAGPAGVFLVNGIIDLVFTCQDPPTSFWPVHGSIVAKVDQWDFKKLDKFRLNLEGGSIDLERGCVKFKEAFTCRADKDGDYRADDDNEKDKKQFTVSCESFFTNVGFETNFTAAGQWTSIACFDDPKDSSSYPSEWGRGYDPLKR